jgi:hypothetical protein
MSTRKIVKQNDPLRHLLEAAENKVLIELIEALAIVNPEVRRECFEYLKTHVKLSPGQKETSEGETVFALWGELEPDLTELDDYGGGDYALADHVADLLYEIVEKLTKNNVPQEYREHLLNEVLPYIQSSNAGLDDDLYSVAYACCYDNEDLSMLAFEFEVMKSRWSIDHARRIYLKIGDNKKYLELRSLKMEVGADYHELANFYWEQNEKEKAILTAKAGLSKGYGRLDELRQFLSERAQETGDRQGYLQLQFQQTVDRLTLKKYLEFEKLCTPDEWGGYEDAVLKKLGHTWDDEKLKIHMHRNDYDKALATLLESQYPYHSYGDEYALKVAAKLETRFPDKLLGYYQSGLGHLNRSLTRKEYGRKGKVMKMVRHMYVNIMNEPELWTKFARQVKLDNKKRPAFQEEFEKAVPGWGNL